MKGIKDIRIILINENESKEEFIKKFLLLRDFKILYYTDENGLKNSIDIVKREGYRSKEVLILKNFQGRFLQPCPCSSGVICCNYWVINTCFNCLFNCTYCFLNSYLNSFGIVQFTNIDKFYKEIDTFLENADTEQIYRIGTGEFTDSLMMDEVTAIGEHLITKTKSKKNVLIELKSKSKNVDHLLDVKEKGNTVLSWSLNTERNISRYEEDTASLTERIQAAKKAELAGYFLAFHVDPIIIYEGWEKDYKNLIDFLFHTINPERIVWISMGCFRYSPGFKERLRDSFPDEEMTVEEMFPGIDGKFRYLKNKRLMVYKTIKKYINYYTYKPFIYLCMETSDIWYTIFKTNYTSSNMLGQDFSNHLKNNFLQ